MRKNGPLIKLKSENERFLQEPRSSFLSRRHKSYPRANHTIPRVKFIPARRFNCVTRNRDQ